MRDSGWGTVDAGLRVCSFIYEYCVHTCSFDRPFHSLLSVLFVVFIIKWLTLQVGFDQQYNMYMYIKRFFSVINYIRFRIKSIRRLMLYFSGVESIGSVFTISISNEEAIIAV